MTNNEKLNLAEELILEIWDTIVPDRPDQDAFTEINWIAERIVGDLQDWRSYLHDFDKDIQK